MPHPDELPEVYATICQGRSLEPEIMDGTCLVFSKRERPRAGDFVSVWRRVVGDEADAFCEVQRLVFEPAPSLDYPGSTEGARITLESLNPPIVMELPASQVLALHKAIGRGKRHEDGTVSFDRLPPSMMCGKPDQS